MQFRLAYVAPESRVVGAGELVDHPKKIASHYLRSYFSLDLFIVLPLPQVSSPYPHFLLFIYHHPIKFGHSLLGMWVLLSNPFQYATSICGESDIEGRHNDVL